MNDKNDDTKSPKLEEWFYDFELARTSFQVTSYENEQIDGMLSVSKLWKNVNTERDPFDVEIVKEWDEGDIKFTRFYYTSRTVSDGAIRIYAVYGSNKNRKSPALFHIHGGGQTANEDWVRYLTQNGYAVLSIDWGGIWDHKVNGYAKYPESLYYANHQFTDRMLSGDPSMFGNPWYEWCYACMRGITYLTLQPEANADQIGIFGISMGGSMVWNIAAIDKRVKASLAIYGAGWAQNPDKFENKIFIPDDQQKIWFSGMAPEIYAQYIKRPIMILSASNDFHGNMDRLCDTFDALPATTIRRLSFGISHNHHIEYDQSQNLLIWFDSHFKTDEPFPIDDKEFLQTKENEYKSNHEKGSLFFNTKSHLPRNPQLFIVRGEDGIPEVIVKADDNENVEWIKMFYALENTNPRNRYWQEETAVKSAITIGNHLDIINNPTEESKEDDATGIYSIKAPVMNADKYLFAYASVKYKSGLHLSSEITAVIPMKLQCMATANKTKMIYDSSEGKRGWAGRHWTTDPIPLVRYYVDDFRLLAPEGGGVSAFINTKIITSRLSDPRFSDDGGLTNKSSLNDSLSNENSLNGGCDDSLDNKNDAAMKFEFLTTQQANISISFGDEPLKEKPYSTFEKSLDFVLGIGETTILINPKTAGIENWSNYPQITVLGLDGEKVRLCKIYWE